MPSEISGVVMASLDEIKIIVNELGNRIGAPLDSLLTFGNSRNDGTPEVSVDNNQYYYVARDRDAVCTNRKTSDLDELLYWIFNDITLFMASAYVRKFCGPKDNPSRMRFTHQLVLLEVLNIKWKERCEKEKAKIKATI
jgi:hypothetical protein